MSSRTLIFRSGLDKSALFWYNPAQYRRNEYMKTQTDFGRVITAMITPFQPDHNLSIDWESLEKLACHLLKNGSDSLLLAGSTGEAAQLDPTEKWEILRRVRQSVPTGTTLLLSTGDTNTKRAIDKTLQAFDLGADGALVAVPEYIKPPQEALFIHFNAIARAARGKPILIYNIPGRTGTEILPETVARLTQENENIIGIKQSFNNIDKVSELKQLCRDDFVVYSGDDSLTLPMLSVGAHGVISVASHLEGNLIQKMVQDFQAGQVQEAIKIHQTLFPLYKALFMTTNPLPVKEALFQKGMIKTPTLRTLGEMSSADKAKMAQALKQMADRRKRLFDIAAPTRSKSDYTR